MAVVRLLYVAYFWIVGAREQGEVTRRAAISNVDMDPRSTKHGASKHKPTHKTESRGINHRAEQDHAEPEEDSQSTQVGSERKLERESRSESTERKGVGGGKGEMGNHPKSMGENRVNVWESKSYLFLEFNWWRANSNGRTLRSQIWNDIIGTLVIPPAIWFFVCRGQKHSINRTDYPNSAQFAGADVPRRYLRQDFTGDMEPVSFKLCPGDWKIICEAYCCLEWFRLYLLEKAFGVRPSTIVAGAVFIHVLPFSIVLMTIDPDEEDWKISKVMPHEKLRSYDTWALWLSVYANFCSFFVISVAVIRFRLRLLSVGKPKGDSPTASDVLSAVCCVCWCPAAATQEAEFIEALEDTGDDDLANAW